MTRKKEVFDGRTWTAQQDMVRQALAENPWLIEQLGKEWCDAELLFSERKPIDDVHPLYFYLGSSVLGDRRITRNMRFFLDQEPSRFNSLLKKLKERDRENVRAMLMQLHAFCILRQRGIACTWEPPTVGKRSADLGIPLADGKMLFLEVFTVFPPISDRLHDKLTDKLRVEVNAIPGLAYYVSPWIQGSLDEKRAAFLLESIKQEIASGALPQLPGEKVEKTYAYEGFPITKVEYWLSEDGEGYWTGSGQSDARIDDAAHIKSKFLDKLAKFQLPPKPALGGYLMCLDTMFGDFHDVLDAVKGQQKLAVTRDGEFRDIRERNGVVHHEKGANIANVDCIVVVKQPSNDWTNENMKVLMNTDQNELTKEEVEGLFLDPSV